MLSAQSKNIENLKTLFTKWTNAITTNDEAEMSALTRIPLSKTDLMALLKLKDGYDDCLFHLAVQNDSTLGLMSLSRTCKTAGVTDEEFHQIMLLENKHPRTAFHIAAEANRFQHIHVLFAYYERGELRHELIFNEYFFSPANSYITKENIEQFIKIFLEFYWEHSIYFNKLFLEFGQGEATLPLLFQLIKFGLLPLFAELLEKYWHHAARVHQSLPYNHWVQTQERNLSWDHEEQLTPWTWVNHRNINAIQLLTYHLPIEEEKYRPNDQYFERAVATLFKHCSPELKTELLTDQTADGYLLRKVNSLHIALGHSALRTQSVLKLIDQTAKEIGGMPPHRDFRADILTAKNASGLTPLGCALQGEINIPLIVMLCGYYKKHVAANQLAAIIEPLLPMFEKLFTDKALYNPESFKDFDQLLTILDFLVSFAPKFGARFLKDKNLFQHAMVCNWENNYCYRLFLLYKKHACPDGFARFILANKIIMDAVQHGKLIVLQRIMTALKHSPEVEEQGRRQLADSLENAIKPHEQLEMVRYILATGLITNKQLSQFFHDCAMSGKYSEFFYELVWEACKEKLSIYEFNSLHQSLVEKKALSEVGFELSSIYIPPREEKPELPAAKTVRFSNRY